VVHPSRRRHFGHPELVAYVQSLGRSVKAAGLGPLMVGDLSQPRGGRAPNGHASHQTGLDADLDFTLPDAARTKVLSAKERERFQPRSVLDPKRAKIQAKWTPRVRELLQLAASDARVSRIFVNPVIKRELCASASGERAWLSKLRPWYGHDAHFHVRLRCPTESADCVAQEPLPPGDGCGADLAWWFSAEARAEREEARRKYQSSVDVGTPPPARCMALVQSAPAPRAK